ncbi:MAG: 3-deoxy-manno-octulosonate cytidylyltransferase [Gammaproteobacteria bacterium]
MIVSKAAIIIPARMASSRYPNKPFAKIKGHTMIERVWRIAKAVPTATAVWIATDCLELAGFVKQFGAEVIMTPSNCATGTDRVAEACKLLPDSYDVIFSLQGDAVLTPPWVINDVLDAMLKDRNIKMATPAVLLKEKALENYIEHKKSGSSTGTTVTFDKHQNALYFSKALIPFARTVDENYTVYRHIGLYAYRPDTLNQLLELPMSQFEKIEQLEQLRALENNIPIKVVIVDYQGRTHGSVDRPEDVAIVEHIIQTEGELVL